MSESYMSEIKDRLEEKDSELRKAQAELTVLKERQSRAPSSSPNRRSLVANSWQPNHWRRRLCGQTVEVSMKRQLRLLIKFLLLQVGPTVFVCLAMVQSLVLSTLWSPSMKLHWLINAPSISAASSVVPNSSAPPNNFPRIAGPISITNSLVIQSLPGVICILFVFVHLTMIQADSPDTHSWLLCFLWLTPCVITPLSSFKVAAALHLGEAHWLQLLRPLYLCTTGWAISFAMFTSRISIWYALRIRSFSVGLWFSTACLLILFLPDELARCATVPGMTAMGAAVNGIICFLCSWAASQQAAAKVQSLVTHAVVPLSEVEAKGPAITDWTQRHNRSQRSVRFEEQSLQSSTEPSMAVSDRLRPRQHCSSSDGMQSLPEDGVSGDGVSDLTNQSS